MDKAAKRAAVAAYKERAPAWGAFVVRCADGRQWVGASRHLDTQQNGLWFTLRMGSCLNKSLQDAWSEAGESAFEFAALEQLPADTSSLRRGDLLKQMAAAWREKLGAEAL